MKELGIAIYNLSEAGWAIYLPTDQKSKGLIIEHPLKGLHKVLLRSTNITSHQRPMINLKNPNQLIKFDDLLFVDCNSLCSWLVPFEILPNKTSFRLMKEWDSLYMVKPLQLDSTITKQTVISTVQKKMSEMGMVVPDNQSSLDLLNITN
jgi:hypothetical protein